ncbi:MAG: RluA family pseudouridine synthase [Alphaproteobacteria bacterium]|nr:RluA family pseudouridine synthase [Alphaproteobacteria bacterium]
MAEELIEKIVSHEESGIRLDRCLRLWVPHLPQGLIEKAARKGILTIQGVKAKPATRVAEGNIISFPKSFLGLQEEGPEKKSKILTAADKKWLKSLILYEDADIVVLNKPAGIAVQGGTKQAKSLDALMATYFEDCKPRLVHRLDLDTSGVLVMAKTLPMARWITQAFKERSVQKIYWALVSGVPKKKEGVISLALSKKPDPIGEKVRVDQEDGLRATTYYRILESLGNKVAWLELAPKTGRTHQLRVHCAEGLNTPILGDGKYGGKDAFALGRKSLHLHARALVLPLPHGKTMTFEAPLSKDMQETFQELGFEDV